MDTKRIFLAAFLIVGVWFFWQSFVVPQPSSPYSSPVLPTTTPLNPPKGFVPTYEEITTTIENNVFRAVLTNKNGGSFVEYELLGHLGTYDVGSKKPWGGIGFNSTNPTGLLYKRGDGFNEEHLNCNPCIESLNEKITRVEVVEERDDASGVGSVVYLLLSENDTLGTHKITYSLGDDYAVNHQYKINDASPEYTVTWRNGIRPAERYYWLDDQYSYAMYANKNGDSDYLTGNKNTQPLLSSGDLDWVGVRNLFFVAALVPSGESKTTGSRLSPVQTPSIGDKGRQDLYKYEGFENTWVNKDENSYGRPDFPSAYDVSLDFVSSDRGIEFDSFVAPLDYSLIKGSNIKNLDWIMTLGGSILKPISKLIINTINFLQNQLPFLGMGAILILFAFLVRLISGPLTKMSLRSTQKMQEVQPTIKKIQEKYKSDPKVMQMKIMQTYKEHNVNPLSGCLVMFLQWPIMIPPFIVFRSVVDFRGESFLWIKDLSEPDYLVSLPFHIPLLGTGEGWTGIGILPILMGVTLFLTMKKTMANMEGQNKVMLYGMNGMFIVLFNGFPAALNLYYVVYNLLNYLQQRKKDGGDGSLFSKVTTFYKNRRK